MSAPRRLRADLPFRRIALVLSGGGTVGAYEVGVLKVLETLALAPAMIAGVSVGAINAVVWVAHGRRTAALADAWRRMRAASFGLQWMSLSFRMMGSIAFAIGVVELFLTLAGTRELSGAYWLWKRWSGQADLWSTQLDLLSWAIFAGLGLAVMFMSRRIEDWLSRGVPAGVPIDTRRRLGRVTLALAIVHVLVWILGWPWPHRFSAMLLLVLGLVWLASGGSRMAHWMRQLTFRLMPDTGGRGLWNGIARRRVLEQLVATGERGALLHSSTELIVSALAVDTGRVTHFTSWPHPSPAFVQRIERDLGEVVPLRNPAELISAAVASSAIPGVFEPERIDGRDFVDAGGFSNQPLHVVIANGADAVIVVLMIPTRAPVPAPPPADLFALAGRLLEVANWRDLQTEMRELPAEWSRSGNPAPLCVVEPAQALPGRPLTFDPARSGELIALGERDAWRALETAGWLETPGDA